MPDKTIDVWDFVSGKQLRRLRGHTGPVFTLALTRNGKTLASASEDGTVRLWDVGRGNRRAASTCPRTRLWGWLSHPTTAGS